MNPFEYCNCSPRQSPSYGDEALPVTATQHAITDSDSVATLLFDARLGICNPALSRWVITGAALADSRQSIHSRPTLSSDAIGFLVRRRTPQPDRPSGSRLGYQHSRTAPPHQQLSLPGGGTHPHLAQPPPPRRAAPTADRLPERLERRTPHDRSRRPPQSPE